MGKNKNGKRKESDLRKLRREQNRLADLQEGIYIDVTRGKLAEVLSGRDEHCEELFARAMNRVEFDKVKAHIVHVQQQVSMVPDASTFDDAMESKMTTEEEDPLLTHLAAIKEKVNIFEGKEPVPIPLNMDLGELATKDFVAEIRVTQSLYRPQQVGKTIYVDDFGLRSIQQQDPHFKYKFIRGLYTPE
jgi:hypothetical protein